MTSKQWRLEAATVLSAIVFHSSLATMLASGPLVVVRVAPHGGATGVDPAVTIVAGISASYPSVNTTTVQMGDSGGNLLRVVVFAQATNP